MNAVELKNVSFSYDGQSSVLAGIDFCAGYGAVTLIAGCSGQGKSTLLSIISGIIPNVHYGTLHGTVLLDGADMHGKKLGTVCRKVGVVLQNADEQLVHKYVDDEIAFGCENLAFPPEKIQKQIEIVCRLMKLDTKWRTRTLSGGQKQRLITASTLAMGQRIILLDEPLANLDLEGAAKLMETLRSLAKAGYCIIICEHRLDMVLSYTDHVWHMEDGRIRQVQDKTAYLGEQSSTIPDSCPSFQAGKPLLNLQKIAFRVKCRNRTAEILKEITCQIPEGGRTVLLGENGCGKTTLLRLIARLYRPSGGRIFQNIDRKFGQNSRGSRAWYRKVGVVYQNPDYQLFMPTVAAEIGFGAHSPAYADQIMDLFGLRSLASRHPQSLSEGQKRRVSIAAVAACAPELLLLDEPTVGQDYAGLRAMVNVLNTLHAETGNTMIIITHDRRCAEALCDHALYIADGAIRKQGGKELVRWYFSNQGSYPDNTIRANGAV